MKIYEKFLKFVFKKYGHTILDLIEIISGRVKYAGVAGILEDKSQIRLRISRISGFKGREKKFAVLVAMMLFLFGCSVLVNAHDINGGALLLENNAVTNDKDTVDNEETGTGVSMDNGNTNTNNNVVPDTSVKESANDSGMVQNNITTRQKNAADRQSTTGTQINADIRQQDTETLVDETFDESENDLASSSETDQTTGNPDDTFDEGVIE